MAEESVIWDFIKSKAEADEAAGPATTPEAFQRTMEERRRMEEEVKSLAPKPQSDLSIALQGATPLLLGILAGRADVGAKVAGEGIRNLQGQQATDQGNYRKSLIDYLKATTPKIPIVKGDITKGKEVLPFEQGKAPTKEGYATVFNKQTGKYEVSPDVKLDTSPKGNNYTSVKRYKVDDPKNPGVSQIWESIVHNGVITEKFKGTEAKTPIIKAEAGKLYEVPRGQSPEETKALPLAAQPLMGATRNAYEDKIITNEVTNMYKNASVKPAQLSLSAATAGLDQLKTGNLMAPELSKRQAIISSGDTRPSDKDVAAINPDPSISGSARRFINVKVLGQLHKKDVEGYKLFLRTARATSALALIEKSKSAAASLTNMGVKDAEKAIHEKLGLSLDDEILQDMKKIVEMRKATAKPSGDKNKFFKDFIEKFKNSTKPEILERVKMAKEKLGVK